MPRINQKQEKRKAALLWSVVEDPGLNTTALKIAMGVKTDIAVYQGDFCSALWPLLWKGVVSFFPVSMQIGNRTKHRVVFHPGPRIAYGKKRWPRRLFEEEAPVEEAPKKPVKREKTLADEFSDYIKEHFRPRRDDETENQYMREAGNEFRRWKADQ
jgi:hypothetical protein